MMPSLPVVEPLQRALHLRSLDLFGDLDAHELAVFACLMREQWLRRGEVLHSAGQGVQAVFLLVEGRIRLEQEGRALRHVEAPEAVGLVELLAQVEAPARALAETNALALVIDASALLDVLEDEFSIFLQLRSALGRQVRGLQRQLGREATWEPPSVCRKGPPPTVPLDLVEQLIWLHRAPELGSFGAGVLAALIRDRGERRLAPGESLWAHDAEAAFFALVIDGVVRCDSDEAGGGFPAGAGTLLGLDAAFAGMTHAYGAVAETPVVVIRIDVPVLLDVAEDHFHVAVAMLSYSARLLLRLQERAAANVAAPRADGARLRNSQEANGGTAS